MKTKKLFEILALVNGVESNKWSDVRKIVEYMPLIEVKQKKWSEIFKQKHTDIYPLDLSKIETWSTYDGECINLIFTNQNNKLCCNVKIYDGDNMNGHRRNLRFTATLVMPNKFMKELEQKILYALDRFAQKSYDEYLENKEKLWILNFKSKVLGVSE